MKSMVKLIMLMFIFVQIILFCGCLTGCQSTDTGKDGDSSAWDSSAPDTVDETSTVTTETGTNAETTVETTAEATVETTAEATVETTAQVTVDTDPETTEEPTDTEADGVIAKIAVFSDVHTGKSNISPLPDVKFASALDKVEELMPGYDAVVIAGDLTDRGTDIEYKAFMRVFGEHTSDSVRLCAAMGNHEYFRDGVVRYGGESEKFLMHCQSAYKKYIGKLYSDTVVGGVHIICLAAENSAAGYTGCDQYLMEHVRAAADENPDMPIIIVAHEGTGEYFNSGSGNYSSEIKNFLNGYPQIIFFSGHTHLALNDPRMIMQKYYTNIQTSTVGADLWNYSFIKPDQQPEKDQVSQGMLVTVSDDMKVSIERYDFLRGEQIGETWVIDTAAVIESKKNFTYTSADRIRAAAEPTFPEGAEIVLTDITDGGVKVTFPAATVTDEVSDGQIFRYNIKVTDKTTGIAFYSGYVLAQYYLGSGADKIYSYNITGLLGGTQYKVSVEPESVWSKLGEKIYRDFTTAENDSEADDNSAKVLLYADYSDNSYEDKSGNALVCEIFGKPRIDGGVAILDKESAYAYKLTGDIYAQLTDKLSIETEIFIEADQTYPWGYVNLISNTESGGFGLLLRNNGTLDFEVNVGGTYYSVTAPAPIGQWIHLLLTYDNTSLKIYINGKIAASEPCTGKIKHVAEISRKLFVGADVNGEGNIQTVSNCRVKYVKLYDTGLSANKAYALATERNY